MCSEMFDYEAVCLWCGARIKVDYWSRKTKCSICGGALSEERRIRNDNSLEAMVNELYRVKDDSKDGYTTLSDYGVSNG